MNMPVDKLWKTAPGALCLRAAGMWHNPCMPAGKRDKFEEDWAKEWERDKQRARQAAEPLKAQFEELRHTDRWLPPLLVQMDEAAVFIFRDAWPKFTAWLRRSFPRAAEALPTEKWAQIGWLALGLVAVDWVVTLGPRTGHNLVQLAGLGMAGYAGWQVWRRMQQVRRDDLAQRFIQHTTQLGDANMEQRIAALGALDQLAYDYPRYRVPLVRLLLAWLDARDAEEVSGHDTAVARQMVQEFNELLVNEPVAPEETVDPVPAAAQATAAPPVEIVTAEPVDAAAASPAVIEPALEVAAEPVVAESPVTLEVLGDATDAAEQPDAAEPLPSQEHDPSANPAVTPDQRVQSGD